MTDTSRTSLLQGCRRNVEERVTESAGWKRGKKRTVARTRSKRWTTIVQWGMAMRWKLKERKMGNLKKMEMAKIWKRKLEKVQGGRRGGPGKRRRGERREGKKNTRMTRITRKTRTGNTRETKRKMIGKIEMRRKRTVSTEMKEMKERYQTRTA